MVSQPVSRHRALNVEKQGDPQQLALPERLIRKRFRALLADELNRMSA
jgi:hypothetical protein